jgi:hypothetical protein
MHPRLFPVPPELGVAAIVLRGFAAQAIAIAALGILAGIVTGPVAW